MLLFLPPSLGVRCRLLARPQPFCTVCKPASQWRTRLAFQTPGQSRKRARASLSDISSLDDVEGLSVRQLKEILARNFVNYSGCCEKWELVEKVSRLYRETEANHKLRT